MGRDGVQRIDNGCEPLGQLGVTILESVERLDLFSEYSKDRFWRLASVDHGGKWVVAEILSGVCCVLSQGSIEEGLQVEGGGGCLRGWGHRVGKREEEPLDTIL